MTRIGDGLVRALYGILLVMCLACPRTSAIWIEGQEAPGRPVFGVGRSLGGPPISLGDLLVAPCEGYDGTARQARWFIIETGGSPEVSRVTYGQTPGGYRATTYMDRERPPSPVPPLDSGCYVADLDGTGVVRFDVKANGSVLQRQGEP